MSIIAKLSFPIKKAFEQSITDAFDQFKRQGYANKLKTSITSDLGSDHKAVSAFLCDQIAHMKIWWYVLHLVFIHTNRSPLVCIQMIPISRNMLPVFSNHPYVCFSLWCLCLFNAMQVSSPAFINPDSPDDLLQTNSLYLWRPISVDLYYYYCWDKDTTLHLWMIFCVHIQTWTYVVVNFTV